MDCLVEKYVDDATKDSLLSTSLSPGLKVETVGWEKLARKQANLSNVHQVGLANCRIHTAGDFSTIGQLQIQDLDLSRNLINDWAQVAHIANALHPHLTSLRLNYNRFLPFTAPINRSCFRTISILSLNSTMITWDCLNSLASTCFTQLVELHVGYNRISCISPSDAVLFPSLKVLNLEANRLDSFANLASTLSSIAPCLETLYLDDNCIVEIPSLSKSGSIMLGSLSTLHVSSNKIDSSTSLLALSTYPSLSNIRFKHNPISLDHSLLICHLQVNFGC